jgi:hypothetical protein
LVSIGLLVSRYCSKSLENVLWLLCFLHAAYSDVGYSPIEVSEFVQVKLYGDAWKAVGLRFVDPGTFKWV